MRALADRDQARARRERKDIGADQRVVQDDIRLGQQTRRAQREQVGRAGASTDQIDAAHARIIPAAAVWLVTASISTNAPVAGDSA